jgi:hypothetical protein
MRVQYWKKLGKIFSTEHISDDLYSHAAVPFLGKIDSNGLAEIYFSARNKKNQSVLSKLLFDIKKYKVLEQPSEILLAPEQIGRFDSDGVMGCGFYSVGEREILSFIGWNLGLNVPFRNSIGLAEKKGYSLVKLFEGPVLDRSIYDPCFVASNCVIKHHDKYLMYYLSCTNWSMIQNTLTHHYHIKIAESQDGFNWNPTGKVAIDFLRPNEYAISVPRVIKDGELFKMWFSFRGGPQSETYRIGYAESEDAIHWKRMDKCVNFELSKTGWDSDMICYPYIFDFEERRYMLYNGNAYGLTGFGMAVLNK